MKKAEDIYNIYHIPFFDDPINHNIGILKAMEEYAKQAFIAARETKIEKNEVTKGKTKYDMNIVEIDNIINKYNDFDDYLNELNKKKK